jgi:elongation factor G
MEKGILAGYPMTDMKVVVYDGTYHEVDSSEIAFKIAGSLALEQAAKRADMVLLEPIMKIEVATPDEYMGDIIGDLSSRRCQIQGTQERAGLTVIDAIGPLANMRGYATGLRSLSKGRASFYMEPSHYDEVPANVAETIIEKGATN